MSQARSNYPTGSSENRAGAWWVLVLASSDTPPWLVFLRAFIYGVWIGMGCVI